MAANEESIHAQVARALSAVADGGLWGRGLRDTVAGPLPAGDTDFILAVMWDKLGGLAVLLTAILIILLGAALRQVPRYLAARPGTARGRPARASVPVMLVGSGLAAMIVGNFLVVLLATLNLIPHTGIPAPFLSHGGQSTLALLTGIAVALALAHPRGPAAPATAEPRYRRPAASGVLVPLAICLACVVQITLWPYQSGLPLALTVLPASRPVCPARSADPAGLVSPAPNPAVCSTDRLAFNRTVAQVRMGGVTVLQQVRPDGVWRLVGPPAGGLVTQDLAGLVNADGAGPGVIDVSFTGVFDQTAGSTLHKRLFPPSSTPDADAMVDLTIDPGLQHTAASALRAAGPPAAGPLAGGVVAIDATTGQILVSATAPARTPSATVPASDPGGSVEVTEFLRTHQRFGPQGDHGLDGSGPDPACEDALDTEDLSIARTCWLWDATSLTGARPSDAADADLRRYVDNAPAVTELPSPAINRAVGQWYGLGSSLNVVTAAAYLNRGGRADDLISASGRCAGARAGLISLRQALSVSCDTAFAALASQIGWSAIARQAAAFGLTVGDCGQRAAWLAYDLAGTRDSCVPVATGNTAIGSTVPGGQDGKGTPLGMATIMAAVANGGVAVQPTMIRSWLDPLTGRTGRPTAANRQVALSHDAGAELIDGLSRTAVDGAAAGLRGAVGGPVWVATGTREVVPDGEVTPPGHFVRVDSWLIGFVSTRHGPVAFAIVVEAGDKTAGSARAQGIAQQLGQALRDQP